jgi:hypothetical protein
MYSDRKRSLMSSGNTAHPRTASRNLVDSLSNKTEQPVVFRVGVYRGHQWEYHLSGQEDLPTTYIFLGAYFGLEPVSTARKLLIVC